MDIKNPNHPLHFHHLSAVGSGLYNAPRAPKPECHPAKRRLLRDMEERVKATLVAFDRFDKAAEEFRPLVCTMHRKAELRGKLALATDRKVMEKLSAEIADLDGPNSLELSRTAARRVRELFNEVVRPELEVFMGLAEAKIAEYQVEFEAAESKFFSAYGLPREATSVSRLADEARKIPEAIKVYLDHNNRMVSLTSTPDVSPIRYHFAEG